MTERRKIMKEKTSVIGTLYKEALGFVGLDEVLEELGLTPAHVRAHLLAPETNHLCHFQFTNQKVISYVHENRVALMLRGIETEILYDHEIEVGDTVTLKSGGQVMTVSKIDNDTVSADLIWNNVCSCGFGSMFRVPLACLVPANPPA
jgi:hypothetical protein